MTVQNQSEKTTLLREWARYLVSAARRGGLGGQPIAVQRVEAVAGPRAGALEIYAGLDSGRLLRALSQDDAAMLRQLVPWQFVGQPSAFMAGRFVRVEAGWPDGLAETMIRLRDLGRYPRGGGRWVVGRNEYGQTVIGGLDDRRPHYLVGGATGSGKSVALHGMVLQLASDHENQLVLIDGKYGHGLREVAGLPGVVGPLAVDGESAKAALGWVCAEMRRRYETGCRDSGRVVVVMDEFRTFADDAAVAGMMRRIAGQGRAARVHLVAATHHPTVGAFGDSETRRNMTARIALLVGDAEASRGVVGGSTPRADRLNGSGDAYTISPGAVNRVQVAFVDGQDFERAPADGRGRLEAWPVFEAEAVGQESEQVNWSYSDFEMAVGLVSASQRPRPEGRDLQAGRLAERGVTMGSPRADRLISMSRGVIGRLGELGYGLLPVGS